MLVLLVNIESSVISHWFKCVFVSIFCSLNVWQEIDRQEDAHQIGMVKMPDQNCPARIFVIVVYLLIIITSVMYREINVEYLFVFVFTVAYTCTLNNCCTFSDLY